MQEAMRVFDGVVNNAFFRRVHVILFLNKIDLFQEKIRTVPLVLVRYELDTILSSVPLALYTSLRHTYTSLHSFTSCWEMIAIRYKGTAGRQKCSNSLVRGRLNFALHMPLQ